MSQLHGQALSAATVLPNIFLTHTLPHTATHLYAVPLLDLAPVLTNIEVSGRVTQPVCMCGGGSSF